MRHGISLPCIVAGIAFLPPVVFAGENRSQRTRVYYTVVQINGIDRSITYEVVEAQKVATRRSELMKEYQDALRAWNKEAADFRKDKDNRGKKFEKPRPAAPSFLTVERNFRDRAAAEKLVADLEAMHCVVRIKGSDGTATYEAVQSIKLYSRKAELNQEYKEALARWEEEAAAFRKENPGKPFDQPRPGRPSLIVVRKDLKDQATAADLANKLQAQLGKKRQQ